MSKSQSYDFTILYAKYPRREGKKAGMAKLAKIINSEADYRAFAAAVDEYADLCRRENRDPKYIKMWSTFVNNFTDYLEPGLAVKSGNESQIERILKGNL